MYVKLLHSLRICCKSNIFLYDRKKKRYRNNNNFHLSNVSVLSYITAIKQKSHTNISHLNIKKSLKTYETYMKLYQSIRMKQNQYKFHKIINLILYCYQFHTSRNNSDFEIELTINDDYIYCKYVCLMAVTVSLLLFLHIS